MRVKSYLVLLSLALMLMVPQLVLAVNPVHNFDCKSCHLSGLTINELGGDNVCLTCHGATPATIETNLRGDATSDAGFVTGDASSQYGNNPAPADETSHNWAATSTNPAAGAAEPIRALHPGFFSRYGTTVGSTACSRCHNPHGELDTNPTLLPLTSDNVTPMAPNDMCLACHKTFGDSAQASHGLLSHPMVTDYATFQSGNDSNYKVVADDSTTAPDAYANGVQLVNGDISCLSCHNLHFTDSDSDTADGPLANPNNGDGLLLRGNGTQFVNDPAKASTFCTTCHNLDPAASMHGSTTVDMGCMGCHGGHNYNDNNPSYFMLTDNYTELPTEFGGPADRNDLWGGTQLGVVDGFCETCHGDIGDPPFNAVRGHNQGENCSACHLSHAEGAFSDPIGCDGCHGSPPSVDAPGNSLAGGYIINGYAWAPDGSNTVAQYDYADIGAFKDETATPHTSHAGTTSNYKYQCKTCHNTHIDDFAGTHNKDNSSFQDVLESGYSFDSSVVATGAGDPSYDDGDATGTCSTVYCHSNGGVNDGVGTRTFGFNDPNWSDSGSGSKGSVVGTAGECQFCHGNDAATMTTRSNSDAHQAHLGEGFSCNICHVDTATSSTALKAGAINTTHISQAVDVAFDSTSDLKTGGAPMSNGSNPWGGEANVTCSAVYCHSSGQSVAGDRTYQSLKWTDTPTLGCTGCHDVQNGNNESPSHVAHVSGSASDLGRDLDCGVCHADTVDVGDNDTVTTPANHVNGIVNIKMNIFDDTGSCSNIDCHSDGNFDGTLTFKDAAWGTVLADCDDCHGDGAGSSEPSYPNGGVGGDSNSHNAHVGGGISCAECHSETTASDTAIDGTVPAQHVNKTVEIVGTKIDSYTPATETCSATACHGGGTPQWGGNVACGSCHAANNTLAQSHPTHYDAVAVGDYTNETNSSTAGNYLIQCGVCHSTNGAGGITHAGGWVSSTAPLRTAEVNFDGTVADATGTYTPGGGETEDNGFYYSDATCANLYCHGEFSGDGSTDNGNSATPTWGGAAACGSCHDVDTTIPMDGGMHDLHVGTLGVSCDYCHAGTAVNAAGGIDDKSTHVNAQVEWELDATKNVFTSSSTYNGANFGAIAKANVGDGTYGNCANMYCHSDVQPDGGVGGPTSYYNTASWTTGTDIVCGSCHNTGVAQVTGSHTKHYENYGIVCFTCHVGGGSGSAKHGDYAVDVSIHPVAGGSYNGSPAPGNAYGSCSTTYCHSGGTDGVAPFDTDPPNVVPAWGGAMNCSSCHDNTSITTNAHDNHLLNNQSQVGTYTYCSTCHAATANGNSSINTIANHANAQTKLINISFGNNKNLDTDLPTYNSVTTTTVNGSEKTVGTPVASCDNVYCHSVGNLDSSANVVAVGSPSADFKVVAWDAIDLNCADCHGDGNTKAYPVYTSGAAGGDTANSHVKHVEGGTLCFTCHESTTTSNTIDPTLMTVVLPATGTHLNRVEDVSFNSAIVGGGAGYAADKTCSATYCHGSGAPQWGGAALDCDACHSASSVLADSHGVHYNSASVATTINTNNDSVVGTYIFQCGNCHDGTTHAGGEANAGIQAAEVSLSGSGTYTPTGTTAGTDRGFKYTAGSCNTNDCHNDGTAAKGVPNTDPTWTGSLAADCTGCHDNNAAAASSMGTGSHAAHVNDGTIMSDKACNSCHNVTVDGTDRAIADKTQHIDGTQDVDLSATYGGAFAANDCNNVYCHSDGQAIPTYNTVTWGTTINDCVSCHDEAKLNTTLSGAHEAHVWNATTTIGTALGCVDCHDVTVSDNTTIVPITGAAVHVNTTVDVMTCSAIDCHSNGNYGTDLINYNPNFASDTLDCFNCHGDNTSKSHPTYANGGEADDSSNSHVAHVEGSSITCIECHSDTSTDGTSIDGNAIAKHVDSNIDVVFEQGGGYVDGTDTCSATYCHGSGTPIWGGAAQDCASCHSASNALADSHGSHYEVATDAIANNTNNDSIAGSYVFQCGNCHNAATTTHAGGVVGADQAAEVDLAGTGAYTAGAYSATDRGFRFTAGTCDTNDCHNDGTAAKGAPNTAAPQWTVALPVDCTGCHDNNAAAVSTMGTGAHTKHIDNANNGASKACQSCHNATVDNDDKTIIDKAVHVNGTLNVAILGTLDGGNSAYAGSCDAVYCHSTGQSTSDGSSATPSYATATWATPASGACGTCHDVTEVAGLTSGSHGEHLGTSYGDSTVNGCGDCHTDAADDASSYISVEHVDKTIDVANTYGAGGAPGNGYGTCTAASCHDNGTGVPAETPAWGTASTCNECHLDAMISGTHAAHLNTTLRTAGSISCGTCHADAVRASSGPSGTLHVDSNVDVYNSATGDFGYPTTVAKHNDGVYSNCSTSYCHGDSLNYKADATVDFTPLWGSNVSDNSCDYCHGYPPDGGGSHPSSSACVDCHDHVNATNDGFDNVALHIDGTVQISGGDTCTDCHGGGAYKDPDSGDHAVHTDADTILAGLSLTNGDYGTAANWYDVTYDAGGSPLMGCGQCHPATEATHLNGSVQNDLDPAGESIDAPNAKLGSLPSAKYTAGTGICSLVYCHSNGDGTFADSPSWDAFGGNANIDCASCHGNSPTTAAHGVHEVGIHYAELYDKVNTGLLPATGIVGSGAAHGDTDVSTTINCFTCHNGTVTDSANAGNTTCSGCHNDTDTILTGNELARIQASSSVHLNGEKNVTFAALDGYKTKAQLRDNLSDADDGTSILSDIWARITGYKGATDYDQPKAAFATPNYNSSTVTCSTVACHNNNDAVWAAPANDCMTCHTSLPK